MIQRLIRSIQAGISLTGYYTVKSAHRKAEPAIAPGARAPPGTLLGGHQYTDNSAAAPATHQGSVARRPNNAALRIQDPAHRDEPTLQTLHVAGQTKTREGR